MFADMHRLDNLTFIVDNNKVSMLDYSEKIIDISPLHNKFKAFNWDTHEVKDGHDVSEVYETLNSVINMRTGKPKVVIVNTLKGKGVPVLEQSSLSHILTVPAEMIDKIVEEMK